MINRRYFDELENFFLRKTSVRDAYCAILHLWLSCAHLKDLSLSLPACAWARSHNYGLASLPLALYRGSLSSIQRSDLCRGRQDRTRVSPNTAHLGRRFPRCSRTIYYYFLLPAIRLNWRFKRRLHRMQNENRVCEIVDLSYERRMIYSRGVYICLADIIIWSAARCCAAWCII